MILTAFLAMAAPASPHAAPPIPPIVMHGAGDRMILTWVPGEVRCGEEIVTAVRFERPLPVLSWGESFKFQSISFAFDIDPSGRPIGIHRLEGNARVAGTDDIAPSLAASRFAAGNGQTGCTATYAPVRKSINAAAVEDLMTYSVHPTAGPLPKEGWDRIYADGNCRIEGGLRLKNRAFPDFRSLPATPGVRDWSMVRFDVDTDGVPNNVETVAGTGNVALDRESRNAVAATRYYEGGVTGCRYPYWRSPADLVAPPAPEQQSFRPVGSNCPAKLEWTVKPSLRFPEPYRRRAIEGWAVITFDVAPWGEISNIKVAASQPTEDFGTQAISVVRGAKVATTHGYVGCVEKVKFNMWSEDDQPT